MTQREQKPGANPENFEFAALADAKNYRQALIEEFRPLLKGKVIEIGAGIGQMTELLAQLPHVTRALAVEPNPAFCAQHRAKFPKHEIFEGTVCDLAPGTSCDAILSVNVLEHIKEDENELSRYQGLLQDAKGALCLFVPARPEIYAPIDKDFGHFRRYTRKNLTSRLQRAGFRIISLHYYNSLGYFAWWLNFCLLRKRVFETGKVRLYDQKIFPLVHAVESQLIRPPVGQSLIATARAGCV